jgi:hypothetical protein
VQDVYVGDVPEGIEVFYPHLMCSARTICPGTIPAVALDGFQVLPAELILETYVTTHRIQGCTTSYPLLLAVLLACSDTTLVLARMVRARAYVVGSMAQPA